MSEWTALPWHHQRLYMEGMAEEMGGEVGVDQGGGAAYDEFGEAQLSPDDPALLESFGVQVRSA